MIRACVDTIDDCRTFPALLNKDLFSFVSEKPTLVQANVFQLSRLFFSYLIDDRVTVSMDPV